MIFLIYVFYSLYCLCSFLLALSIPLLAVWARSAFIRRDFISFRALPAAVAFLFFLAPLVFQASSILLGRQSSFDTEVLMSAFLQSLRLYVGVIAILNLRDDPTVSGAALLFLRPLGPAGNVAQYITRYPSDMKRRIDDIVYSTKMRLGHKRRSVRAAVTLIAHAATAVILEMVMTANRLSAVTAARGQIPPISWWKRPAQGFGAIVVGDLCFVVLLALLQTLWNRDFVDGG